MRYATCGHSSTGCWIEVGLDETGESVTSRGVADANAKRCNSVSKESPDMSQCLQPKVVVRLRCYADITGMSSETFYYA